MGVVVNLVFKLMVYLKGRKLLWVKGCRGDGYGDCIECYVCGVVLLKGYKQGRGDMVIDTGV